MTYNVFGGTLSLTQSINRTVCQLPNYRFWHCMPLSCEFVLRNLWEYCHKSYIAENLMVLLSHCVVEADLLIDWLINWFIRDLDNRTPCQCRACSIHRQTLLLMLTLWLHLHHSAVWVRTSPVCRFRHFVNWGCWCLFRFFNILKFLSLRFSQKLSAYTWLYTVVGFLKSTLFASE